MSVAVNSSQLWLPDQESEYLADKHIVQYDLLDISSFTYLRRVCPDSIFDPGYDVFSLVCYTVIPTCSLILKNLQI
jgi:hypothetical protein